MVSIATVILYGHFIGSAIFLCENFPCHCSLLCNSKSFFTEVKNELPCTNGTTVAWVVSYMTREQVRSNLDLSYPGNNSGFLLGDFIFICDVNNSEPNVHSYTF